MRQIVNSIGGFMSENNTAIWDTLLCHQQARCIQGNILEIGVFKGRSASILCQHKRPDEELWLVDFSDFLDEAIHNTVAIQPTGVRYIKAKSSELWRNADLAKLRRSFRWLHIDGEHTGNAVANDLTLAAELLSDDGMICVDDFFSPSYPQITAAVFSYIDRHPFELQMLLCGENKAYLARPTSAAVYTDMFQSTFAAELKTRGVLDLTIFKTSPTSDYLAWGLNRRCQDRDYYGLDSNPDVIY